MKTGDLSTHDLLLMEFLTHHAAKEFDRYAGVRAFGNNDVRGTLRRLDELEMHRPDRAFILLESSLERPASFIDVAAEPPHKADIVRRIYKYANVQKIENTRFGKDKNALHDHDRPRLDNIDAVASGMRDKII